ncbi:hypothetical protein N9L68_06590 [bacterium]|nr:hypothetical protein [bacterium]
MAYDIATRTNPPRKIGLMVVGNSGRPGGAIFEPWGYEAGQRLGRIHPGNRTQEESVVAAWLVGSEGVAPQQLRSDDHSLWMRRMVYGRMEDRFMHLLHRKWGMLEGDIKAFEGFIRSDGSSIVDPSSRPDEVRRKWLATVHRVDYVNTRSAIDYGDAWALPVSAGGRFGFRFYSLNKVVRTTLISAAGPIADPRCVVVST